MALPDPSDHRSMWNDVDAGWAMTVELVTATFVWGGFGWLVDRWLDTEPWFMVGGFVVGFGLGMYLVILRAADQDRAEQARKALRDENARTEQARTEKARTEARAEKARTDEAG